MEKILFAKYNRNRKDKFQLSTMICESDNEKYYYTLDWFNDIYQQIAQN